MNEFVDDEGAPDFEGARDHVLGYLVSFVRALRRGGAEISANASVDAARALAEVGFDDRDRVRSALRTALVTREEDLDVFEQQFPAFWRQLRGEDDEYVAPEQGTESPVPSRWSTPADASDERATPGEPSDADLESVERSVEVGDEAPTEASDGADATASVYSPAGRSRTVTAPRPSEDGARLEAAMRRLTDAIASLRGRRWARTGGKRRARPVPRAAPGIATPSA